MNKAKEKIKGLGKKSIFLIIGFFVLILIIIFGGAYLYNKFFYKRSYTEIENIMMNAAQNYTKKHEEALPQELGGTVSLSANELEAAEEMDSILEYTKDETTACDGTVIITKLNDSFRYRPILNCDKKYKTNKFIDEIQKRQPIVESGNGLYKLNEELVFRGDNVNNYLKLGNSLYRIVKFSNEETIIIYSDKYESTIWDDRYNKEKDMRTGINDYSVSKIRDYINSLYYKDTKFFSINTEFGLNPKNIIIPYDLQIGRRESGDTDKTGTTEKKAIMEKQMIGLLPLYDFMNASLDADCTKGTSPSCVNYNYLSKYIYRWWTMTGTSLNTYNVYQVADGIAVLKAASSFAYVRPVVHLAKDAIYVQGEGTYENPYIVK